MDQQRQPIETFPVRTVEYRLRSFGNLLRMGHCAPTVMRTLLDISALDKEWLVKFSAGMPGGIGNTGYECGGVTSPLALLGLNYGLREIDRGLPVIFDKGHALCQRFLECHKTMRCTEIRGQDKFPMHCIRPVLLSPELFGQALANDNRHAIPEAIREGYRKIYSHMTENGFHCARTVFERLGYTAIDHRELFDAASAFMGGTLFMGLTCSAFTAGVMAIGLRYGEIENSPLRVIRLLAIMTVGGNAFDENLNKFNRSMNNGYRLSKWFRSEFGSTQCQAITQCDFSTASDAAEFVDGRHVVRCREITERIAERVQQLLDDKNA